MNYLKLEPTAMSEGWYEVITSRMSRGSKEDKARDDSREVAHRNAILILKDEFMCEKDKKSELIVFDMELEEGQIKRIVNNTEIIRLQFKAENMNNSITYIHKLLKNLIRDNKNIENINIKNATDKNYMSRILNKCLLNILEEDISLPFDYFL